MKKNLFILFILCSLVVQAQWTKYTAENTSNYFKNNNINAIKIDSKGNKWFGTGSGLTKFDGQNWTTFTTVNGLVNNTVNCIAEDALGYLWIGTEGGVSKYNGKSWTNYTKANGLVNNKVLSIAVDANGYKWFATEGGISKFTGTYWYKYEYIYGLDEVRATAVEIESNGNIWFGYGFSGFGSLRKNYGSGNPYDNVFLFNPITSIAADSKGIWVGTSDGGVVKIEGNYMTTYDNRWLNSNYVMCIAVDSEDNKWFGTDLGATLYNKDGFWGKYNTSNSGLCSNKVNAIAIDKQKNVWFGTNNGVSVYDDGFNWKTYSNDDRLASGFIYDIEIDAQGNKWILSEDYENGIYHITKFDGTNWKYFVNSKLNSLKLDSKGNAWFGTSQIDGYSCKVFKFDGKYWTSYLAPSEFSTSCKAIDTQGKKWFGTKGRILSFDDTNWKSYTTNDLTDIYINDIFIDTNGNKWIGTYDGGVFMFDGINWTNYNTQNSGLLSNNVFSIAIDSKGSKWFGTDSGVSKLDDKKWTSYTSANGIDFYYITNIEIDLKGTLWFSSINLLYNSKSYILKFDGTNWVDYSLTDSDINTDNIHSITADVKGNIWFGTSDGVLLYNELGTGIFKPINAQTTFDIYPNPVIDGFRIKGIEGISSLQLTDLSGKVLLNKQVIGNEKVSLAEFPTGMYMINLSNNGVNYQKIVMKK